MTLKKLLIFLFSSSIILAQELPENIIVFIGDGMGLDYVTAQIILDKDNPFVKFTATGLSLTSSADHLITDSGAGATAISTGYRTNNYSIGVDTQQKHLLTLLELAKKSGKSIGVVATSSVTNATPAAFLAHVSHRKYETEIARQIYFGEADLVIGGGKKFFASVSRGGLQDSKIDYTDSMKNKGYNYFERFEDIKNADPEKPLYALLEMDALKPAGKRSYSLSDLVSAAVKYLSNNDEGFVLMVEGSQIDWAAHDHKTYQLLKELSDFAGAVNTALNFADDNDETLVLVTSDHETGGGSINDGEPDGRNIEFEYNSLGHTAGMVGIFAKGPGEDNFKGVMPNNEIGRKLFLLIDPEYKF